MCHWPSLGKSHRYIIEADEEQDERKGSRMEALHADNLLDDTKSHLITQHIYICSVAITVQ